MSCGDKENSNKNAYQRAERECADNMRAEVFLYPSRRDRGVHTRSHHAIALPKLRRCVQVRERECAGLPT